MLDNKPAGDDGGKSNDPGDEYIIEDKIVHVFLTFSVLNVTMLCDYTINFTNIKGILVQIITKFLHENNLPSNSFALICKHL